MKSAPDGSSELLTGHTVQVFDGAWAPAEASTPLAIAEIIEDPARSVWIDLGDDPDRFKGLLETLREVPSLNGLDPRRASMGGESPPAHPPKAKAFRGFVFSRAYWLRLLAERRLLCAEEVHLIVGPSFAITMRYPKQAWKIDDPGGLRRLDPSVVNEVPFPADQMRRSVQQLWELLRNEPTGETFGLTMAIAFLDSVIDSVFDALDLLRGRVDELETEILKGDWMRSRRGPSDQQASLNVRTLALRRLLRQIRWAFVPSDEIDEFLTGPFMGTVDPALKARIQDLSREADRAIATVAELGAHVQESVELRNTMKADRLNRTTYVLTAVATTLLVPTLVAGIYGMNFHNMPELRTRFGYFGALTAMAILGTCSWLTLRWYLRRKDMASGHSEEDI